MYGDYEAQRHWMELTVHLPMHEWYNYDLQYWGLDYPPLTAYVSWLCGIMCDALCLETAHYSLLRTSGHIIDPAWVALDSSRGIETQASKNYMRATVLMLDLVIYVPALLTFVRQTLGHRSATTQVRIVV